MKKELHLEILPYKKGELSPVMSEDTIKYHRDKLAAGYVNRFNSGEGDSNFNEAGAFLHNIFFPQLKPPAGRNLPHGISLEIIESKYKSYDAFREAVKSVAMKIQGSGWVYMDCSGEIKTIKDHQIKPKIALLIDWWEHAWALDYQHDKAKYLDNIWKIINWDVVNDRLNTSSRKSNISKKSSLLNNLVNIANRLDSLGLIKEAAALDTIIRKASNVVPHGYLGIFLTPESIDKLKDWWNLETRLPLLDNEFCHHMTIKYKPSLEEIKNVNLGKNIDITITGWAADNNGQAVTVGADRGDDGIAHITVSTSKGVTPKYSNELLKSNLNSVKDSITLSGRIGFYLTKDKKVIYDLESLFI